ncbi:MAG TPA: cobalamin-dependent protein [Candidatus Omnitrophota bacterium]|nr:cobalamin-dependent protein [Candidatus Omnitrophota bacterium]HRZ14752.1 cobalamin-dependent protein [Candidatus Omnitrophota bacterium]
MKILLSSICLETGTDLQLALYYLKGYLLKRRFPGLSAAHVAIRVFNERASLPAVARTILEYKPGIVGFSCYLWNIAAILKLCRLLKRRAPQMKIVLGGPEASPRAREILEREKTVDAVVRGEGEAAFAELVEAFCRDERALVQVQGISFRRGAGIISTPDRRTIVSLGAIPSPYLSGLVDLKDRNIIDVPLETTRGCALRCGYCYYHKNFPAVRHFPLRRVERELKLILSRQPREVYVMDATFNADRRRAMTILELFRKYNRSSTLHVELMAELVDEPMARALARARALNIEIGLQSVNPRTLKALHRPFNKERFAGGIELLNAHKLIYEIQLIDALPYQTYAHLMEALDWLYALHPARVVILRLAVLAGTALRQQAAAFGIEHSAQAPYYARKSRVMSAADMQKLERLRFAMERLYDSQVFQKTLYALKDAAGLKISSVLESWITWESRIRRRGFDYPLQLNRKLPEFLEFLLRRQNKMRFFEPLVTGLRRELAEYRKLYSGG